ncbi:hypothetical protein ANCCAN_03214 [Ancylostoma caninum]|uniref:SCP domain-containing protein n=1 Tax=Ancylostoma caninum TaxID=29170 RepID=A0A368H1W5_ANCCA|nr:hypothetical protein ANCCAN_03214 [Ancylostoma caninum]
MLSAGLLFLLSNILVTVAYRQTCNPATGTYRDRDSILNPLAKLIEEKVPGASYACALEPRTYLKFIKLGEETWNKVYPNVHHKKELKFSTVKPGNFLKDPKGLAEEAVKNWEADLEGMKGGKFGCVIDKPTRTENRYNLFCIFQ